MSILTAEHLSYVYGEGTPFRKDAVEDINFTIEKGQLVGIIGHTGSGKSTLIQQLNGLLKPTSGRVLLDGQDIWADPKKIRDIRFKVGMVFQYPEYQLFDETVYKDISFGPRNMGLEEREIDRRVRVAAELVELPDSLLQKSPFDLSGGEKRRAAIAGVVAMQPQVLILDEPTAGLDPKGRDTIMNLIQHYRDETGSTVLFVSHSMEDIARLAERVLVLNRGHVALFGPVQEVFSHSAQLSEMGLNIPQVTRIFLGLKARGYAVDDGVFTVQQGVKELLRVLGKGGEGNA